MPLNRILVAYLSLYVVSQPLVAEKLTDAFLAQCEKTQTCLLQTLTDSDLDPGMVEMMTARMAGQCEAQLVNISAIEDAAATTEQHDNVEKMTECFRALSALSCAELESEPDIPECD